MDQSLSLGKNSASKLFPTPSYIILTFEILVIKHDFGDFKSIYLNFENALKLFLENRFFRSDFFKIKEIVFWNDPHVPISAVFLDFLANSSKVPKKLHKKF